MQCLVESAGQQAGIVARTRAFGGGRIVDLGRLQVNCPAHGPHMSTGIATVDHRWSAWSPCPACMEELQLLKVTQLREMEARALEYETEERIARADAPQRFTGKVLDDFKAVTEDQKRVRAVGQDFVDRFSEHRERGASLVFAGSPGTGKSLLAAAVLQTLCQRGINGRYTTFQGLIHAVRATWGSDGEGRESDVIAQFAETSLLVIDEIGAQTATDNQREILFNIIDQRYSEMRPTVLATNLEIEDFKTFIGDRSWDRLTEIARWIPFVGDSYRLQARREMLS